MQVKERDQIAEAFGQAQAQYESIKEMVAELELANADDGSELAAQDRIENARRAIEEDALSVEVRGDWYVPGGNLTADEACTPAEYRIVLCTGGPAMQIVGKLDQWSQPETATLQAQDWFTPWTEYRPIDTKAKEILLAYAQCFWFGE